LRTFNTSATVSAPLHLFSQRQRRLRRINAEYARRANYISLNDFLLDFETALIPDLRAFPVTGRVPNSSRNKMHPPPNILDSRVGVSRQRDERPSSPMSCVVRVADFSSRSYWDSRFASESSFEWLQPSSSILPTIQTELQVI